MGRATFDEVWDRAVARKGEDTLVERMDSVATLEDLESMTDDRCLAILTKHVFGAGFRWRVIEAKWDGFEAAFNHFDPSTVAGLDEVQIAELTQDKRIVRNPQKINATVENAKFVRTKAEEHGSFVNWVTNWPDDDIVGLWHALAADGSRLGGATGPRSLRSMGKDTFILTADVAYALTEQGVLTGKPTGKAQQARAQEAFVAWRAESGRPMSHVSIVLACSIDRPDES